MRKIVAISVLLLLNTVLKAQVSFKTIVPQSPVVVGESFQVQYTISDADKINNFRPPSFNHFRFVSGPNLYTGFVNRNQLLKNYVFTLEAGKPGRYIVPGAVAAINDKTFRSDDALIEIISKEEAAKRYSGTEYSEYMLKPGEDPYEKIRQNLFLKVMVDKKSCFTGEPVLATFKLYSRLQSKSDIVKNPGFYGFTVYDMVNLDDKEMSTENVNGKIFDVHTIRKVQLFPLQPGMFTIDAMEVKNRVEFPRSIVNKKTEQEIVEGVLNNDKNGQVNENAEAFETTIRTDPVMISVKPVPLVNKPPVFDGAAGIFNISSVLTKGRIAKNEEGFLDIVIRGQGNFTQLNAPVINWPVGIEGFEPVIRDSLDKTKFPLSGSRTFRYTFICNKPGLYHLPSVIFSFFDPNNNIFKTVSTAIEDVEIHNEEKKNTFSEVNRRFVKVERKESIAVKNARASRIAAGIIISLVLLILVYWVRQKKEPVPVITEKKIILPTSDKILAPAYSLISASEKEFYTSLHQCIWNFLAMHFNLSGSGMNKRNLADALIIRDVNKDEVEGIISVLEQCEAGMFTNADMQENKETLLERAKLILENVSGQLL